MSRPCRVSLILLLASCAADPHRPTVPAGPADADLFAEPASRPPSEARHRPPAVGEEQAGSSLRLEEALEQARAHSPELLAAQHELEAQAELAGVAGRLPDPELSVGVEGVPFSSPRSNEELLAGVRQPIPLGGRLSASESLAATRLEAARLRGERIAAEVDARLRGAYATALSLQNAVGLQGQRLALAHEAETLTAARVEAGELTPETLAAARALRAEMEHEVHELRAQLATARDELYLLLGRGDDSAPLEADLDHVLDLPAFQELADRVAEIPAVAEALAEARAAELQADLVSARRIPDVNLDLFYRRRADERNAFDVGLSFELPLSGTASAESRAAQARSAATAQRSQLRLRESLLQMRRHHAALETAIEHLHHFDEDYLPASEAALRIAESRRAAGDLSLLETIPVRDADTRTRLARLDAWHRVLSAWAQLTPYLPID